MFIDLRTSGWKTGQKVSWPTEFLEGCRGVLVGEWQDVAVDPQGGGGVAVPEPVLGLQDVPLGNQNCGHRVSEPVQGDVGVAGVGAQFGESVRETGRREPGGVIGAAGKQPRPESLALAAALPPLKDGVPPQGGGGRADGEPADPAGLGGTDDLVGRAPGDGQHVTVQVGELQGGELAPPGAGVRGQSGEQQNLFSAVQP